MKPRLLSKATLLAIGIVASGLTGTVSAATYSSGPISLPILDNSSISNSITVPDSVTVGNLSVTFDMDHTWVGDLVVELEAPGGTTVDIICNVGSDCAGGGFGSSSDLLGSYTFEDGGAGVLLDAVGTTPIPSGVYQASTLGDAPVSLAATFGGINSLGDWRLTVFDIASGDEGMLNSWSLEITAVPVPAAVWLFGSGLIGLVGIARRKST